jgi:2-oxo-4-hydroxy-4-carboxy-5-ureidoimidazoline decarboxylase
MTNKTQIGIKKGGWQSKNLSKLNENTKKEVFEAFMQCNTSEKWCESMADSRPYADYQSVLDNADAFWGESEEKDLLQAFEGHPEIGDVSTLREKYRNTEKLAGHEQSGVNTATENTLQSLSQANKDYKEKFGFIFIVCASGKSADEMLALLLARLPNTRDEELVNAAEEQRKITHLRLDKFLNFSPLPSPPPAG